MWYFEPMRTNRADRPRSVWGLNQLLDETEAMLEARDRRVAILERREHHLLALLLMFVNAFGTLRSQYQRVARMLFGRSSERQRDVQNEEETPSDGIVLDTEIVGDDAAAASPDPNALGDTRGRKRRRGAQPGHKGHGRRIPGHLPVEDRVHAVPQSECLCGRCGKPFHPMGEGAEEVSYEIDIRIQYVLVRHRRPKYAQSCSCSHVPAVAVAPPPAKLIPKGMLTVGTVAHLLVQKYLAHIPFARQVRLLGEQGLNLSPGTISNYMRRCLELFRPLYQAMWEACRQEKHWQIDETSWRMFVEREGKQGHRWWVWIWTNKKMTLFVLDPTRSSDVVLTWMEGTEGIISTDAYSVYRSLPNELPLTLHQCWAHVRRLMIPFLEESATAHPAAVWMRARVREIGDLYAYHDARRRHPVASPLWQAAQHGMAQSFAAIEKAWKAVIAMPQTFPDAVVQLANRMQRDWEALTLPLHRPELPLDNNTAERRLRELVLERNTIPGTFSEWGGEFIAVIYSVLQSCRQNGVNPTSYLRFYLEACLVQGGGHAARAPDDLAPYLPWNLRDWVPADKHAELFGASEVEAS